MRATIRKIVADRGFAFGVLQDESSDSVFVHASALLPGHFERLEVGSSITIEALEETERGYRARGVAIA